MEDQTQAVLGDEEEGGGGDQEESDINPVGYLRVLSQKDLEQTDYPVQEGEVTLGRGSDCDLVIEARSLSRRHATLLVDGGTHFVQDLDSRNKTYRGTVQLRPNAFYELTNGCELTFADIKCVYYIGSLPDEEGEEGEGEGGGEGGEEEEGDSDETDDEDDDVNAEPTQAYHFDGAAAEGKEEGEGEGDEPMECDATVAYRIEAEDDDNEDSPPSSPILVATKQLLPKEDAGKIESSSPSGAKKPSKSKKVCFATGTAPGSVEGEASTSKALTSKKEGEGEGGDETDGEETDGEEEESTQPHKEGKEKAEGSEEGSKSDGREVGSTITPALKEEAAGAGSVMDVDEGDPTVAYELETDEENTDAEDSVAGSKEEKRKTEGNRAEGGAASGAEPTVPYNLEEKEDENNDSDKTDVEQEESETVPEISKEAKKSTEAEAASGLSKKEGAAVKVATAGEHSEGTDDGEGEGDTEKVESSATEPESQEVKEKPAHLRPPPRVARNAKTLSAVSLMDCTEQGQGSEEGGGEGATVLLESYESTCDETVPLHPSPPAPAPADSAVDKGATATMATVAMETLPLSPSAAPKEEEEEEGEGKEEPQPLAGAQNEEVKKEEESDGSDSLFPELSSLGSKGVGGSKHSRQKTLFEAVSSKRGRGRGGRRGRGRKVTVTRKAGTRIDEPSVEGDTEDKKPIESKSDAREKAEPTVTLKTEEDTDKKNEATTADDATKSELKTLDSIGGISGKVANLRLKTLSLVTPDTASSSGDIVTDGTSAIAHASKNEIAAASEGVKVKEQGSKRGRGRGRKRTTSRQTSGAGIGRPRTITEATSAAAIAADTVDLLQEEESPDLPFLTKNEDDVNDQSDHSVSTTSTASLESSHSGRGRKGKGRGGASKRGRATATPRRKSTETAPKARTPSSTPSLRQHRTPSSASRAVSKSPSSTPGEKPRIMFTGLIDKTGERTIRELGGELVDSVYQCTHLITDKVRRTVKFLCCLSRGCLIVSDAWLDQCATERRFLPAEPYLIRDKPAERQHKFTLQRSHESAKVTKLLAGYKVYLTPHVKPEREQMSDIIKCSGGEAFDFVAGAAFSPAGGEEKVIVIACEEDLALCKDAMESGAAVHSTELILGGVLRQELELHNHLMTALPSSASASMAGRKRRAKESSIVPAAKRKRK